MSVPPGVALPSLHPSAATVVLVQIPLTGNSHRCFVGRNVCRRQKTLLLLAEGTDPCAPHNMTPTPISITPLPPPPSPPPQETIFPRPHFFRRSPICPPENRHRPGGSPDRHSRPHRRRYCLAPRTCRFRQSPIQTLSSHNCRYSCRTIPVILPPSMRPSRIPPLPLLSRHRAVVARPPAAARPRNVWP